MITRRSTARKELERLGEIHPSASSRKELEHEAWSSRSDTRRSPRISLPPGLRALLDPRGVHRPPLPRIRREPVRVNASVYRFPGAPRSLRRLAADGAIEGEEPSHRPNRHCGRISKAKTLATPIRGKWKRAISASDPPSLEYAGIVDDHVVPLRLRREIAVDDLGLDPPILLRVFLQALERGLELVLDRRLVLFSGSTPTPLQTIELVEVEELEHFVDRDVANDARTPEGRRRQRVVRRNVAAIPAGVADGDVLADSGGRNTSLRARRILDPNNPRF